MPKRFVVVREGDDAATARTILASDAPEVIDAVLDAIERTLGRRPNLHLR